MVERVTEVELLSRATEALRSTAGLSVITTALEEGSQESGHDAILRIGLGDVRAEYPAIIKRHITQEILGALASQLRRMTPQGILVTHHVTAKQADMLKQLNVPFFDTAGNAFLNAPPLFVFVSGRRPDYDKPKEKPNRAFMPSGLRTVFALLCNPGLELQTYRDIAAAANVSHGTIEWVLNGLKKERYLVEMGSFRRQLTNKPALLRRWVETYSQQLRPKLVIGRYSAKDPDWWQQATLKEFESYWGGEVAAAKITKHLRPQEKTIYAPKASPELQVKFGFRRDPKGDIEIVKKFWAFKSESDDIHVVPPLLVYADLIASGDDRNIETAEIIYDTQISRLIGKDSTL